VTRHRAGWLWCLVDYATNDFMAAEDSAASFQGWNAEGRAIVEHAMAAHGGMACWRATQSVRLAFGEASGPLLTFKGYRRSFPAPREYEILLHQRTTVFHGYPDARHRGLFIDGDVAIESLDGDDPAVESRDHRQTMTGFAKYRPWDPLDALYFFGYALWHYHSLPFTLGHARLLEVLHHNGRGVGVHVEFPVNLPTHCRRQQFFFGSDGRILRHDYTAEVIGSWARGCHFWEAYERVDGLLIARHRRVVARVAGHATGFTVLRASFGRPSARPFAAVRHVPGRGC
jgi:hypothetical protein